MSATSHGDTHKFNFCRKYSSVICINPAKASNAELLFFDRTSGRSGLITSIATSKEEAEFELKIPGEFVTERAFEPSLLVLSISHFARVQLTHLNLIFSVFMSLILSDSHQVRTFRLRRYHLYGNRDCFSPSRTGTMLNLKS